MHWITHSLIPWFCFTNIRFNLFCSFYWFSIHISCTSAARTSTLLRRNFYFLNRVIHRFAFLNNLFLSCQRVPVSSTLALILLIIYRFRISIGRNSTALRLINISSSIIMNNLVGCFTRIKHVSHIFSWNWSSLLIRITITLYIIHK